MDRFKGGQVNWAYLEIAPQVAFRQKEVFEAIHGILVRLEFSFGYYKKAKARAN